jgi:hypothetical protein
LHTSPALYFGAPWPKIIYLKTDIFSNLPRELCVDHFRLIVVWPIQCQDRELCVDHFRLIVVWPLQCIQDRELCVDHFRLIVVWPIQCIQDRELCVDHFRLIVVWRIQCIQDRELCVDHFRLIVVWPIQCIQDKTKFNNICNLFIKKLWRHRTTRATTFVVHWKSIYIPVQVVR